MTASTNSLLISAGILLLLTLSDPFVNTLVAAVSRTVRKMTAQAREPEAAVESFKRDAA